VKVRGRYVENNICIMKEIVGDDESASSTSPVILTASLSKQNEDRSQYAQTPCA
jgi:hypothetical protein